MRDYSKTTIRLKKIHERSLKKTYVGLTLLEKQIVKNHEAHEQFPKDLHVFWSKIAVYQKVRGRHVVDQVKTDWSLYYRTENALNKVSRQLEHIQNKHQLDDQAIQRVLDKFYRLNRCRFYGGSF